MGESKREYLERMDIIFQVNEIDASKKTVMLLTLGGASLYSFVSKMVSPEEPKLCNYEKLCVKLKDQLEQKVNVVADRYNFRHCMQKEHSITEYIMELKSIAQTCKFQSFLSEMLRDQLVTGVRDEGLRKRLLRESELTFEQAESIARTWEAADEQNETFVGKVKPREMAAIKNAPKSIVSKQHYNHGGSSYHPHKQSNEHANERKCYRCGRLHNPQTCPARSWQCFTLFVCIKYLLEARFKVLNLQRKINQFLISYRNNPCTVTKVTPNEKVFCFVPHTLIAKLNPTTAHKTDIQNECKEQRKNSTNKNVEESIHEGEEVYYRNHFKEIIRWIPAVIKKRISELVYLISINGIIRMVHKNQLRRKPIHDKYIVGRLPIAKNWSYKKKDASLVHHP
ncbi:uncharacterized protein LOC125769645 [Anopheles funestus]|uniref:uncharacterized protein LOC125769645 n=1 Tax=Anopheles funestus TaxID=62324 RepID=UPI0020C5F6CE|nr:uncharacterized protein LOC125769645 [Anopheles funestus]